MATAIARTKAIADALINADASAAQIERMVHGFLQLPPDQIAVLSSAQKAQQFLSVLRNLIKSSVAEYEGGPAANAARATIGAAIDADFTEAP